LSGASYDLAPADIQAILQLIADGLTGPVPIEELVPEEAEVLQ